MEIRVIKLGSVSHSHRPVMRSGGLGSSQTLSPTSIHQPGLMEGMQVLEGLEGWHGKHHGMWYLGPRTRQVTYKLGEASDHLAPFQVGLSIQVGCLDVAQPVGVTGVEQQDVCRDDLVAAKTHKVSHADFFPESVHVLLFFPGKETAINMSGGDRWRPNLGDGHTQLIEHFVPLSGMLKFSIITSI